MEGKGLWGTQGLFYWSGSGAEVVGEESERVKIVEWWRLRSVLPLRDLIRRAEEVL